MESSSGSDSDSSDSDSETELDEPKKKKKPSSSSKKQTKSRKAKAKYQSKQSAKGKKQARDSPDSDSDSSDSISDDENKDDGRNANSRQPGKDAARGELHDQLDRLELRVSQLQSQMAQNMGVVNPAASILSCSITPTIPAAFSLPGVQFGSFMPANTGGLPAQTASAAGQSAGRTGRPGLASRPGRSLRRGSSAPRLELQEPDGESGNRTARGGDKKKLAKGTKINFKCVD